MQAYDPLTGYDIMFLRQTTDKSFRGHSPPSPQEAFEESFWSQASSLHMVNSRLISLAPIVQQQLPPAAHKYPPVHVLLLPILCRIANSYILSMFNRCPCLGILAMPRGLTQMAAVAC